MHLVGSFFVPPRFLVVEKKLIFFFLISNLKKKSKDGAQNFQIEKKNEELLGFK